MKTYKEIFRKSLTEDEVADVEEKLATFGISVRKENETFKSLYQIIEELAKKYYIDTCANNLANMADIKDIKEGDRVL